MSKPKIYLGDLTIMKRCIGFVLMLFVITSVSSSSASAQDENNYYLTEADRKIVAQSAAWAVITSLSDGSLGLMIQRGRPLPEFSAVNVSLEWMRSFDGGKSWSEPVIVHERRGPEGELFMRRPNGGYVVFQSRNVALGQLPTGRIFCAFTPGEFNYTEDGAIDPFPGRSNNVYGGVSYTWSDDLGMTWTESHKLPLDGPFGDNYPWGPAVIAHGPIVSLKDGTALLSLYGNYNPEYKGDLDIPIGTKVIAGVIRSNDNGESWGDYSVILTKEDTRLYEESTLALINEQLQAYVRTPGDNVVQYSSGDYGRSWVGPVPVTQTGQVPGGAFELTSGNVLMTWGNRRPPFGAAAMFSFNSGKTFDYQHHTFLGWDSPGVSSGYANGVQADDGTIVVTYYSMPVTSDYRELWRESVVYVVRFTEKQLLLAMGYKPPKASAGISQTVKENTEVTLDGSLSLGTDNIITSYFWKQTEGTLVTLSDATAVQPTFKAPDVDQDGEELTFMLTVTDYVGLQHTNSSVVNVTAQNDCVIATAAYGSRMAEEINTLRKFRDNVLLTNPIGRSFVQFYYNISPPMAAFIAKHDNLRAIVRIGLLLVISVSWTTLKLGFIPALVLMTIPISGLIFIINVRKKGSSGLRVPPGAFCE